MTGYEACILGLEAALELKKRNLMSISGCVWHCISEALLKKIEIFYFFSLLQINIFFDVFRSF
jgi:hypothetical protein